MEINMFMKDVCSYPTEVHQRIYRDALRLTPLEVTLAEADGINEELLESCKQFHSFITNMLWDMYLDPRFYGFPVGELEEFLDGRKLNYMKRKFPTQVDKLRSAAVKYILYLSEASFPDG
jgi:hypothetical protein